LAETPSVSIIVAGETYTLRQSDLTGIDAKEFRLAVGMPLAKVFADPTIVDLDVLAGLVWLVRRRSERGLSYEDVARSVTYDAIEIVEGDTGEVEALDGSDPEA